MSDELERLFRKPGAVAYGRVIDRIDEVTLRETLHLGRTSPATSREAAFERQMDRITLHMADNRPSDVALTTSDREDAA